MLIWQYLHDGVPSHHLLHRADLPAISNWWGGLLLPSLSWFLLGRIGNRIQQQSSDKTIGYQKNLLIGFVCSLLYGALLSLAFLNGLTQISSSLFFGILLIAIFIRVYREQFILGFILSMSITFGAVLPTIFASLIGIASAIVYFIVQFIRQKLSQLFFS